MSSNGSADNKMAIPQMAPMVTVAEPIVLLFKDRGYRIDMYLKKIRNYVKD